MEGEDPTSSAELRTSFVPKAHPVRNPGLCRRASGSASGRPPSTTDGANKRPSAPPRPRGGHREPRDVHRSRGRPRGNTCDDVSKTRPPPCGYGDASGWGSSTAIRHLPASGSSPGLGVGSGSGFGSFGRCRPKNSPLQLRHPTADRPLHPTKFPS